ncbi:DUF4294 domain-containing protein [soil metagenome]
MRRVTAHIISGILLLLFSFQSKAQQNYGPADTLVSTAVIYNGDTLEARTLPGVYIYVYKNQISKKAQWTRLRNAVYVTYPYAKRASRVFNDVHAKIVNKVNCAEVRQYIQTREKELRKELSEPLMNLSVYQGRVLMKLIKRETGNNVYEILQEFKGGFNAVFWQSVAVVFGTNLKQPYDADGADAELEKIVKEVQRMYGLRS